jgi:hypothetical protein
MLNRFSTSLRNKEWAIFTHGRWAHAVVLIPVGLFAFFHNLDISLFEGSEGLYAHITREMVERGDYVHLTYQGEAYVYKSPFFFWILALSTALLGENEIALRLPGSLFSVGTMGLTYALGTVLISSTAAFWAALVVATTHVFLWYGRRVLFDSMLTFFITLALLLWARTYFNKAPTYWYSLSFIAMALATMTKGLHGLALPLLVIVSFLILNRDVEPLKTRSFWMGLLLFLVIIGTYAYSVNLEWRGDYFRGKAPLISLTAPTATAHPIYWYLGVMWFDFFPWSAVIPAALSFVFWQCPTQRTPAQLFVLTWFLGFLVMFSLSPLKREPYLLPMVPALGLMVGYCCQYARSFSAENRVATSTLCLMLGVLALTYMVAVVMGPELLHRRWNVPLTLFPLEFTLMMIGFGLTLLYAVIRTKMPLVLTTLAASSIVFMIGVVHIILPAIDETGSARAASHEIKTLAQRSSDLVHLYTPGWPSNEDLIYYLTVEPAFQRIRSEQSLMEVIRATGKVVFLSDNSAFTKLSRRTDLSLAVLQEFPQRRNKGLYLVLGREKNAV